MCVCVLVRAKQSALSLSRCNDLEQRKVRRRWQPIIERVSSRRENNDSRKYFYLFSFFLSLSPSSFLGYRSTLGREMEAATAAFEF